jgi:hypothetical protein
MVTIAPENVAIFIGFVYFVEILFVLRNVWAHWKPIERVHAIACPAPHLSASYEFSSRC